MNVKLVKLITGEDIITQIASITQEVVEFKRPLMFGPTPDGQLACMDYSPFAKGNIPVKQSCIVYITEPDDKLAKVYTQKVTGLVITG
jgi:hypothetical protein